MLLTSFITSFGNSVGKLNSLTIDSYSTIGSPALPMIDIIFAVGCFEGLSHFIN